MASAPPATTAPPVVPAAALPSWPPSTDPTAKAARGGGPERPGRSIAEPEADRQRSLGNLYGGPGGPGPGDMTVSMPMANSVENSGSLTGHILAQGWADAPTSRSNTTRVIVVLLVGLGILVAVGLIAVLAAGDTLTHLFGGALDG